MQPHLFIMHSAISYYFTQIVDMNRVETWMHNKCMELYGNLIPMVPLLAEITKGSTTGLSNPACFVLFIPLSCPLLCQNPDPALIICEFLA